MKYELYLGIDGGGSKCKARLELENGELLGEGVSGPANPVHNSELAFQSIVEASVIALTNAGFSPDVLGRVNTVMGLAGVNIPKYHAIVEAWKHPFGNCLITTDLHIACLGAHAGSEGAIVITGTGSSAFTSINGVQTMLGGHGFPLGDKAGGAWLGWKALSAVLDGFDGLMSRNDLFERVCNQLQISSSNELVTQALHFLPRDYAAIAPLVLDAAKAGDEIAISIMNEGAHYLQSLLNRLHELQPKRISVIGGLASRWLDWLPSETKSFLNSPLCSPEYGAVALAKQQFKDPQ
ncbi:ATPase [Shewanella avicenniae]|uniref:ATPase n=1 Tax=Shewanella avicenniae TaxID=2814294 RepID=A0ABX7QMK8_9GAMM|nr:BadF/BadG/BcrA/BcrD ATPase family protein [Shewanella avicenniae]QSX32672.1 ATPase [Shewanella avicenniae]